VNRCEPDPTEKMVRWLTDHLERFDPDSGQVPTERDLALGPLVELMICGRALLILDKLSEDARACVDQWRQLAFQVLDRPSTRALILARPDYLPFLAALAAISEHAECASLTSQLADAGFGEHYLPARHPNSRLDARWAFGLAGAKPNGAALDPETLLSGSSCGLPALAYLTENDVYAFTHCLFYVTDFGRRFDPKLTEFVVRTRHLLAWALIRHQLDLVAELLMCLRYLGRPDSPIEHSARCALLAGRQGPAVCGPHWSAGIAATMPDAGRADIYLFRTSFHTTLTAAVALTGLGPFENGSTEPEELLMIQDLLRLQHGCGEVIEVGGDDWLGRSVRAAALHARIALDTVPS